MKHYSTNSTPEELEMLADKISQANLATKVARYENRETSSANFVNGDKLTIASGFAGVAKMVSTEDGVSKVTPYLAFNGKLLHANGTEEACLISLRQCVEPTMVVTDPQGKLITRNQLVKRFGAIPVEFRDQHNSKGEVVTMPYLSKEIVINIVTGKVWTPVYSSFEGGGWTESTAKENYGYAKA
jgi:hypothetical protein